jgi:hypothetical protein
MTCPIARATLRWVDRLVIRHALCPWASGVRNKPGALKLSVSTVSTLDDLIAEARAEARDLTSEDHTQETTLLVSAAPFVSDLGGYLSAACAVEHAIADEGLDDRVQLVRPADTPSHCACCTSAHRIISCPPRAMLTPHLPHLPRHSCRPRFTQRHCRSCPATHWPCSLSCSGT